MSLGAMAASVGLIIDDAIVVIEQIYREHEERPGTSYLGVSYLFPFHVLDV